MSSSGQDASFVSRHKLLLAVIYFGFYGWLRVGGDITHQATPRMSADGASSLRDVVAPANAANHWKRQAYRIIFSPMMVVEEEARHLGGIVNGVKERAPGSWDNLVGGDTQGAYPAGVYPDAQPGAAANQAVPYPHIVYGTQPNTTGANNHNAAYPAHAPSAEPLPTPAQAQYDFERLAATARASESKPAKPAPLAAAAAVPATPDEGEAEVLK